MWLVRAGVAGSAGTRVLRPALCLHPVLPAASRAEAGRALVLCALHLRALRLRRRGVWPARCPQRRLCHRRPGEDARGVLPPAELGLEQDAAGVLLLRGGLRPEPAGQGLLADGQGRDARVLPLRHLAEEPAGGLLAGDERLQAAGRQHADAERPLGEPRRHGGRAERHGAQARVRLPEDVLDGHRGARDARAGHRRRRRVPHPGCERAEDPRDHEGVRGLEAGQGQGGAGRGDAAEPDLPGGAAHHRTEPHHALAHEALCPGALPQDPHLHRPGLHLLAGGRDAAEDGRGAGDAAHGERPQPLGHLLRRRRPRLRALAPALARRAAEPPHGLLAGPQHPLLRAPALAAGEDVRLPLDWPGVPGPVRCAEHLAAALHHLELQRGFSRRLPGCLQAHRLVGEPARRGILVCGLPGVRRHGLHQQADRVGGVPGSPYPVI
mmetsp:Transcript_99829/g.321889  ORF Transcript_99829/g.321889 Transcript_99829/m.321889 type:complete len:438 (+) Transcript_99829:4152-5465(+)